MRTVKVNKKHIYLNLFFCIAPIAMCVVMKISLVYAFFVGVTFACVSSIKSGFKVDEIKSMIIEGIWECKNLYIVILLIGATVSVWISSGVVPTIIYYGLEYMGGMNFLFAAFLLVGLSSIFMGTAIGTISTIGISILGIGKGFGIPTSILVGAIVSGAFLADKISPISGLLNLTLTVNDLKYKEAIKSAVYTLIPTILISAVIYYCIGMSYQDMNTNNMSSQLMIDMNNEFYISIFLLALPILIIGLSFVGIKSTYCMIIGVIIGSIVSIVYQNVPIQILIRHIWSGFEANTTSKLVNEILSSGGIVSMLEVILIVIGAISLSNILQGTGVIDYLTKDTISKIKSKKELIIKTGIISSILTVITCDQTIGIVLPSKLLIEKYEELEVDAVILARTISDTGTIIAPLMSWNVNSLLITLVTGVSCLAYAPFAILCFLAPLTTILFAFNKKTI